MDKQRTRITHPEIPSRKQTLRVLQPADRGSALMQQPAAEGPHKNPGMDSVLLGDERWPKIKAALVLQKIPPERKSELESLIGPVSSAIIKETDRKAKDALTGVLEHASLLHCCMAESHPVLQHLISHGNPYQMHTALFIIKRLADDGKNCAPFIGGIAKLYSSKDHDGKAGKMIAFDILKAYASRGSDEANFVLSSLKGASDDESLMASLRGVCNQFIPTPQPASLRITYDADARKTVSTMPCPSKAPSKTPSGIPNAIRQIRDKNLATREGAVKALVAGIRNPDQAREMLEILGPDEAENHHLTAVKRRCYHVLRESLGSKPPSSRPEAEEKERKPNHKP